MSTKEQEELDPFHLGDGFDEEELAMLTKKFKEDDELEKMLFGKVFSHDIKSLEDIENIPPINPEFKEIFKNAKINMDNCNESENISEELSENTTPSETELFVEELFKRAREEGSFNHKVDEKEIYKKKQAKLKFMKAVSGLVIMLVLVTAIICTSRNNAVTANNKPSAFIKVCDYIKYSVLGSEKGSKTKVTKEYSPTYIPEGYEKVENGNLRTINQSEYKNKDNRILFSQMPNNTESRLDKEAIKYDKRVIKDTDYYFTDKGGDIIVMWYNEEYQYKIATSDKTVEIEELLKMAESAKEK